MVNSGEVTTTVCPWRGHMPQLFMSLMLSSGQGAWNHSGGDFFVPEVVAKFAKRRLHAVTPGQTIMLYLVVGHGLNVWKQDKQFSAVMSISVSARGVTTATTKYIIRATESMAHRSNQLLPEECTYLSCCLQIRPLLVEVNEPEVTTLRRHAHSCGWKIPPLPLWFTCHLFM